MSFARDYEKARMRASMGIPASRMPRTMAEAMGQAQGEAERRRARQTHAPAGEPTGGGFLVFLVFGVLAVGLIAGIALSPLLFSAIAVVGLFLVGRVKRVLGVATSVYVGVLLGVLLGSIELLMRGSRVNLFNLATIMMLGGMLGALWIPIAVIRRR